MELEKYLKAGYPVIWINTLEPARAEHDLALRVKAVRKDKAGKPVTPYRWDEINGLCPLLEGVSKHTNLPVFYPGEGGKKVSPMDVVLTSAKAVEGTVTFLWNFHRLVGQAAVIQAVENAIPALKANKTTLIILAPGQDNLPLELSRQVLTLDFELPDKDGVKAVLRRLDPSLKGLPSQLDESEWDNLGEAALGLTEAEAEDAFTLAYVESGGTEIPTSVIAREKAGALLRKAHLTLTSSTTRFSDLGGMDNLKEYALQTAASPLSLGVLLMGVPGCGKTTWCRALGNELGLPVLELDFGNLFSSLVGSSEAATKSAFDAIDAIGRCVLLIDEIDKSLAGVKSSGELDSGVTARVGSYFLRWLSTRKPGRTYVVATANSLATLPAPYLRSERWDSLWFIDLPSRPEKDAIWSIWGRKFLGEAPGDLRPNDEKWTGSDIMACCRTAAMLQCDLSEAARYIVPVATTMDREIDDLRTWAKGRCLPASRPGVHDNGGGLRNISLN